MRRSARNLQKLAIQNSNDQNEDIYKRDYTLNMSKAMKKKVKSCDVEYKVKSTNRGGNQIYNFSAAMYELYRTALLDHFETLQNHKATDMKIEYKDITDNADSCVETVIRVFDTAHISLKYTVNLYHTKSKMMVNGSEVNSFKVEHLKITQSILANEKVTLLDQELRSNIIKGLKSIEGTCAKPRHLSPDSESKKLRLRPKMQLK